jgi:glycosyltransferase involved in cell wall biosynthesis
MLDPHVSVIINTYNSERFIYETISSLQAQTFKEWEAIVWDNGSHDSTLEIVASFKDDRIHIFVDCEKVSLYQSRVNALHECAGELVAFLDHDDAWLPEKLSIQKDVFQDQDVSCSSTDVLIIRTEEFLESCVASGKRVSTYSGKYVNKLQLSKRYRVAMSTLMARRTSLLSCLPSPIPEYTIIEDFDLVFRLLSEGKLIPISQPLTLYRLHSSNYSSQTEIYQKEVEQWLTTYDLEGSSTQLDDLIGLNVWNSLLRTKARRELQNGSRLVALGIASNMKWGFDRAKLTLGACLVPKQILRRL